MLCLSVQTAFESVCLSTGIMLRNSAPFLRQTAVAAQSGGRGTARSSVAKRGIVEQCCHFYCDYYDLENYCNI